MNKNLMKDIKPNSTYKEMTPGGAIYGGGNAEDFRTGDWRTDAPQWHEEKCKQCLLCFPVCPDASISVQDGKRLDFDLEHCKGCGICSRVCPFGAISMTADKEA